MGKGRGESVEGAASGEGRGGALGGGARRHRRAQGEWQLCTREFHSTMNSTHATAQQYAAAGARGTATRRVQCIAAKCQPPRTLHHGAPTPRALRFVACMSLSK